MKSICLGVWNRERKPRKLMNRVAGNPDAFDSLRKAWRVYAENAKEARRLSKISIPRDVFEGLEAVRKSNLTNMLDRPMVAKLAAEMGFFETTEWLMDHRKEYAEGIFRGFEVDEEA